MKKNYVIKLTIVFVFLLVSFQIMANDPNDRPVAVSPGSDAAASEVSAVRQNCPTFSWSAVDFAASYRIAVFETGDAKVTSYEEMAAKTSPLVSKDIPGPALSWTLSSEENLKTGNMYAWYVQAIDAYGNAAGGWSKGRIFKVTQEVIFVGIEERLGRKMKEYGVSDDVIKNVLQDIDSEVKEVVVQTPGSNSGNIGRIQGSEGAINTYYGLNAGASITTGSNETFIGASSGYSTTSGSENTFIGKSAGYSNISGFYNTYIGSLAGYNNDIGYNNLFIGSISGYANISGRMNTFVGASSGRMNTTGNFNTFLGEHGGYNNDTGNYNTFLGYHAGYANVDGYNNTFIGSYAGTANNSGDYNLFIGDYAGYRSSTQSCNIFIGSAAGHENTTGWHNTFLGYQSGYFNNTGDSNSFFGYMAGTHNNTGYYNTFFGLYAGTNNTTGAYNTYIGTYAGNANSAGGGNVFLGCYAGYNENGSDKLYIDNSSTASPLIYGDFSTNILKINGSLGVNISPIHPLHMSSGAYCSVGGTWTNASSRSLKENIRELSTVEALEALNRLNPVRYNYKVDKTDAHVGFIAEDVPALVATADRKGLSPMNVAAVLTKVVQELRKENEEYRKLISELQERMAKIEKNK